MTTAALINRSFTCRNVSGVHAQTVPKHDAFQRAFSRLKSVNRRRVSPLQKFSSVHDQVRNHFNLERHLVARQVYKQRRLTALDEWRALAA